MAMKTYYYFCLVTFLVFSQVDGALVDGALQKPDVCGQTFLEQAQELSKGLPGITIKGPTTSEQMLSCGKFAGKTLINGAHILFGFGTLENSLKEYGLYGFLSNPDRSTWLYDNPVHNYTIYDIALRMRDISYFLPRLVVPVVRKKGIPVFLPQFFNRASASECIPFFSQFLAAGGVKTYLEAKKIPDTVTQKDIENCSEKFTSFFNKTSHQVRLENWQTDFEPAPFKEAFDVTANLYEVLQKAGQQNSINEACQEDYGKLCQSLELLAVQAYMVHDYQEAKNKKS